MYDEAKRICEEKQREFPFLRENDDGEYVFDGYIFAKSIFDMFPFFAEALEKLKSSESLLTFKQLRKTLSLLEYMVNGVLDFGSNTYRLRAFLGFGINVKLLKLACLHKCVPDETDEQDVKKGPEDMIKALEDGKDVVWKLRCLLAE